MKKHRFLALVLGITAFVILLPVAVMVLWSVTGRWPWPNLLPESYTLRTVQELLFGSAKLPEILFSSIWLAAVVAVLATVVGVMTARATELYTFPGRELVRSAGFLPLLVPGTVFATGIQLTMIRAGLSDTLWGVILVHLVVAMPYCVTIMADVTAAIGIRHEEQAAVLGAGPIKAFFLVTLPQLLPGILASLSMGFVLSYSQYFTTLMVGGGRIKTLALVLVPYIQSGDRALSSIYSTVFVSSALLVFFALEWAIRKTEKRGERR